MCWYHVFTVQYQELPGDFGYSELRLFFTKFRESAKKFAWMTGKSMKEQNYEVI